MFPPQFPFRTSNCHAFPGTQAYQVVLEFNEGGQHVKEHFPHRICLPVQDLRTGILKLTAVAGKIESYKPGRNPQSAPDHGADAMNSDFDDIDLHSQVTGIVME